MSVEGVDYSYGRPGGVALAAAGKQFACRYLTGAGKALSVNEVHDLFGHGIAIVANFEQAKDAALNGWGQGVEDAVSSKAALAELGAPANLPVYFSVDFNAQIPQQPKVDQYLRGAASVLGSPRVGVYGTYATVTRCHKNGTAALFWQTYGESSGHLSPWANIFQYQNGMKINGALVDLDRALTVQYGQWTAGAKEPAEMIYTTGGIRTALFSGPYAHEPGGPSVGTITTPTRFLIAGCDASGRYVAINGLFASSIQTPPIAMGWVPASGASEIQDEMAPDTDCSAAIAADRATARIVYGP
jgi:Domain of unknown function (DUF1906)